MQHSPLSESIAEITDFLHCKTPDSWIQQALLNQEILLINHAYLEKCAARTALNLMFQHPDKPDLLNKMSKLAREELVHFEQVIKILKIRSIKYRSLQPSRYAGQLFQHVSKSEPNKLIDTLIIGAYIEARSCERFACLSPYLDNELKQFYTSLLKSEARHFKDYLALAERYSPTPVTERVAFFGEIEKNAILSEDALFRFHSGVPAPKQ